MGMRVVIENTGDTTGEHSTTSGRVEFHDPEGVCTAERLGELIGYAINGIESFFIPGDVLKGINNTIDVQHTGNRRTF
jgi:hypothetical protein